MVSKHITDEFLQKTVAVWQPYYAKVLTKDDALKILHNITSYFKLVAMAEGKNEET